MGVVNAVKHESERQIFALVSACLLLILGMLSVDMSDWGWIMTFFLKRMRPPLNCPPPKHKTAASAQSTDKHMHSTIFEQTPGAGQSQRTDDGNHRHSETRKWTDVSSAIARAKEQTPGRPSANRCSLIAAIPTETLSQKTGSGIKQTALPSTVRSHRDVKAEIMTKAPMTGLLSANEMEAKMAGHIPESGCESKADGKWYLKTANGKRRDVVFGFTEDKGDVRPHMENRHRVIEHFEQLISSVEEFECDDSIFCCVLCDGHGGIGAAEFTFTKLPDIVAECMARHCDNPWRKKQTTAQKKKESSEETMTKKKKGSGKKYERHTYQRLIDAFNEKNQDCEATDVMIKGLGEADFICECILDGIKITEGLFRQQSEESQDISGTALVFALLYDNVLYTANVGDVEAVICNNGVAETLTRVHSVDIASERKRVREAGGFIKGDYVNGELSVTRALGDFCFGDSNVAALYPSLPLADAMLSSTATSSVMTTMSSSMTMTSTSASLTRTAAGDLKTTSFASKTETSFTSSRVTEVCKCQKMTGVSAVPCIARRTLCDADEFLVVACDGVWASLHQSYGKAIATVRFALRRENDCEKAANSLLKLARKTETVDNITTIVVGFGNDGVVIPPLPSSGSRLRLRRKLPR